MLNGCACVCVRVVKSTEVSCNGYRVYLRVKMWGHFCLHRRVGETGAVAGGNPTQVHQAAYRAQKVATGRGRANHRYVRGYRVPVRDYADHWAAARP